MTIYGEDLFKGAATYYSKYRPMYPPMLIMYLVERFSLNGEQQVMDLGCGPGNLTIRLADWCNKIVGVDPEKEMIKEAKRLHSELRIGDIQWFNGDLEQYRLSQHHEKFELVAIAKAFHWMDRSKVLEDLYDMLNNGGGIAIIDNFEPDKKQAEWQERMNEVIEKWYGSERRAGNTTFTHPVSRHEDVISNSRFKLEMHEFPSYEINWTIESILGNLYSTSFGSKRFLGDRVKEFESELKAALLEINKTGEFKEKMNLSIKMAIKA